LNVPEYEYLGAKGVQLAYEIRALLKRLDSE
jgi:hypothetical protein